MQTDKTCKKESKPDKCIWTHTNKDEQTKIYLSMGKHYMTMTCTGGVSSSLKL